MGGAFGAGAPLISGDVAGTVTDPSGAVVANVKVILVSLDRGETQTTTTNDAGYFRFSLLKPGQYSLTLERAGFKKQERRTNVAAGQVAAASVVNTETSGVATTYDQRIVQDVPNPGGDLTNIAQTAPGATMNTSGGYGNLTVNGMPATSNLFTVNGENDMDPFFNINNSGATNLTLGVNEIQEATVVSNPYSGQYGQQAGAQVTYITKSGTNDFHGSVQYDWNGRVMNANDWFANNSGTPRPFANANQWGADLGGPIFKNKTGSPVRGLPYSVLDENIAFPGLSTYAGVGFPLGQPVVAGSAPGQHSCRNPNQQCFDVNAFIATNADTFAGYPNGITPRRNQYRGPNLFDVNLNIIKNFNITERVKLGIGANFYNVFNHPNFANPNWALASVDAEATP